MKKYKSIYNNIVVLIIIILLFLNACGSVKNENVYDNHVDKNIATSSTLISNVYENNDDKEEKVVPQKSIDNIKLVNDYDIKELADNFDSLIFGKYEQDGILENGKEDIEWIVLDNTDNKLLLLSKYILDGNSFNDENRFINWEQCSLRNWLNTTFYNEAFDEEEKKFILRKTNPNNSIGSYYIDENGHKDYSYIWDSTSDLVSLLSFDEVVKYIGRFDGDYKALFHNRKVVARPTKYASGKIKFISNDETWYKGCAEWFLRTMYSNSKTEFISQVMSVTDSGDALFSDVYYEACGIRPAILIDKNLLTENKISSMLNKDDTIVSVEKVEIKNVLESEMNWEMKFYKDEIEHFKREFISERDSYKYDKDSKPNFVTETDGSVLFTYGLKDINDDNVKELIIFNHNNVYEVLTLTNSWSEDYEKYKDMFEAHNVRLSNCYISNDRTIKMNLREDNIITRFDESIYVRDLSNDSYYNTLSESEKKEYYNLWNYRTYYYESIYIEEDNWEYYELYDYNTGSDTDGLGTYYKFEEEKKISLDEAKQLFSKHGNTVVLNEGQILIK